MSLRSILLVGFALWWSCASATHNRAGEITYEQIGELTIRATIITYTKTSSVPADRDTLTLFWGDGTSTMVPRQNGNGTPLPNDVKINLYVAEHTYPGRASYTLSMMDPNRIGGILNVNPPNSDAVPFYLETKFTFLNTQFQGFNSSPVLLQPPLDYGCVGKKYIHNPNAYDADGDSLSYELIVPLQDSGVQVPNYIFPDQIDPGGDNLVSMNPVTGDFVWDSPQIPGIYNIAILITEYRNGVKINTMIRDMQILVLQCDNEPPVVTAEDEYCVVAGELLEFEVMVDDPDEGQQVILSAFGGPFVVSDLIEINPAPAFRDPPYSVTFRWQTTCDDISNQPYTVIFRAGDSFVTGSDTTGLVDLKTVRITVIGPSPQDIRAEATNDRITVNWQSPYACEMTEDDYFRGFSVWRREGSNSFPIDTCAPGLEGKGYEQIGFDVNDEALGRFVYEDVDVESGKTYCYRVQAEFARLTSGGNAYNRVPGLPSDEACLQLNRDVPLIIEASVEETDATNGEIVITWLKPIASAVDTLENPGPYGFRLLSDEGLSPGNLEPIPGASFSNPSFAGLNDTTFVHRPIDTRSTPHTYRVEFSTNGGDRILDDSPTASSIFLSATPTDRQSDLSWDFETPWNNYLFEVYRRDPGSSTFNYIGETSSFEYSDVGLSNGLEYCYFISSFGTYGIDKLPDSLMNKSQIACTTPFDNVPACPPNASVTNVCNDGGGDLPQDGFRNTITWRDDSCLDEPISQYNIYYSPVTGGTFELIGTVEGSGEKRFVHKPAEGISGCYAVSNVDLNGNESDLSEAICVDNCPLYNLPNAFTPNSDGSNDMFVPFPYRFVERIELSVFNRWGQLVFETTDPDINWDGTGLNGKDLVDGTYHYICTVYEQASAEGTRGVQLLKGYIELIRGSR